MFIFANIYDRIKKSLAQDMSDWPDLSEQRARMNKFFENGDTYINSMARSYLKNNPGREKDLSGWISQRVEDVLKYRTRKTGPMPKFYDKLLPRKKEYSPWVSKDSDLQESQVSNAEQKFTPEQLAKLSNLKSPWQGWYVEPSVIEAKCLEILNQKSYRPGSSRGQIAEQITDFLNGRISFPFTKQQFELYFFTDKDQMMRLHRWREKQKKEQEDGLV